MGPIRSEAAIEWAVMLEANTLAGALSRLSFPLLLLALLNLGGRALQGSSPAARPFSIRFVLPRSFFANASRAGPIKARTVALLVARAALGGFFGARATRIARTGLDLFRTALRAVVEARCRLLC